MDHISNVLSKVLRQRGLADEANASLIVHQASRWLKKNLSPIAEHIDVKSFKDGVLFIETEHSIAAQECQQASSALSAYLRDECGHSALRDIRLLRSSSGQKT